MEKIYIPNAKGEYVNSTELDESIKESIKKNERKRRARKNEGKVDELGTNADAGGGASSVAPDPSS